MQALRRLPGQDRQHTRCSPAAAHTQQQSGYTPPGPACVSHTCFRRAPRREHLSVAQRPWRSASVDRRCGVGCLRSFTPLHPALADEHYLRTAAERQRVAAARLLPVARLAHDPPGSSRAAPSAPARSLATAGAAGPIRGARQDTELHPALAEAAADRHWSRVLASAAAGAPCSTLPQCGPLQRRTDERGAQRGHSCTAATAPRAGEHGRSIDRATTTHTSLLAGPSGLQGPDAAAHQDADASRDGREGGDPLGPAAVSLAGRIGELQADVRALREARRRGGAALDPGAARSLADHLAAADDPALNPRDPALHPRAPPEPGPARASTGWSLADHVAAAGAVSAAGGSAADRFGLRGGAGRPGAVSAGPARPQSRSGGPGAAPVRGGWPGGRERAGRGAAAASASPACARAAAAAPGCPPVTWLPEPASVSSSCQACARPVACGMPCLYQLVLHSRVSSSCVKPMCLKAVAGRSGLVCRVQGLEALLAGPLHGRSHDRQLFEPWCSSGACMPHRQVTEAASWDSWRCPSEPAAELEPVPAFVPVVAAPCAAARGRGGGLPGGGRRSRADGLRAPWAAFLQHVREHAAAAGQVSTRARGLCCEVPCRRLAAVSRALCLRKGALVWYRPFVLSL